MKTNCPTCGAPVEFRYDDSFVRVCAHCRSAVLRTDRGTETLGRTADLVDIDSPIRLFCEGRYRGLGFLVVGRTQLRHPAGGTWQEWYAKMDDGNWGWLAEAQGRYYMTFQLARSIELEYDQAAPGSSIPMPDGSAFQVLERGEAQYLSAEGEIPYRFAPGTAFRFADLGDTSGRFATVDFGSKGELPQPPTLYLGHQVTLAELSLVGGEAPPAPKPTIASRRLACPQCNGSLELRAKETLRIACPYCGALLNADSQELRILSQLAFGERGKSPIALGSTCRFEDTELTAIGYVQRSAIIDGEPYPFDEVLLHSPTLGFRWLVRSDGHWSYVQAVSPAAVELGRFAVSYDGVRFRQFQAAKLVVDRVVGEFYWRVEVGETVASEDYIAPPAILSCESSADERNWSLGRYVSVTEMRTAFGDKIEFERAPRKVAPNQPPRFRGIGTAAVVATFAFGLTFLILQGRSQNRTITTQTAQFAPTELRSNPEDATSPSLSPSLVWFSDPFDLTGGENVQIQVWATISNSWLSIEGDLIDEASGAFDSFDRDMEYYYGTDGGENWVEGSTNASFTLPARPAGRYVLRLNASGPGELPAVRVAVRQDVFSQWLAIIAAVGVFAPALLLGLYAYRFERRRWSDSNMAPLIYARVRTGDE